MPNMGESQGKVLEGISRGNGGTAREKGSVPAKMAGGA